MTKAQVWLKALRLRTLPLSLSGIILGSSIALYEGFQNWTIFLLALLTTVLFQIVSNLANDLGDSQKGTDNEYRIGPMRAVQSGVISSKQMRNAVILFSVLSLVAAVILIFYGTHGMGSDAVIFYALLALACIGAAILYTVGKRAYGYYGLGDLMVFIFFGLVSVMGVYPLYTKEIKIELLLPAACIGLLSTAVLNLNNMRDRANDERSGKNTLVVMMGANLAKLYHAILILGGLTSIALYMTSIDHPYVYIGLIPGIILLLHVRKVMATRDPKEFDPELKKVALCTFGIAVLTASGLIFSL
ncbi:MAG: 1,4-dihydroxy-2-naphthoate octaprenyltransferase, partial [Bacteroidota bacterium]